MVEPSDPAFPIMPPVDASGQTPGGYPWPANGLTKRELFAAMAMQGHCANEQIGSSTYDVIANHSVEQADALLAALKATEAK